jgi:hypothetical protein
MKFALAIRAMARRRSKRLEGDVTPVAMQLAIAAND